MLAGGVWMTHDSTIEPVPLPKVRIGDWSSYSTPWLCRCISGMFDTLNRHQGHSFAEPLLCWIDEIESVIASRGSYRERVEMGDVDFL